MASGNTKADPCLGCEERGKCSDEYRIDCLLGKLKEAERLRGLEFEEIRESSSKVKWG